MPSLIVQGGKTLSGDITVAGNKNAILPCMAAAIMSSQPSTFNNVPDIQDVETMSTILQDLGATITRPTPGTLTINPQSVNKFEIDSDLAAKLRASILLMGPLLARFQEFRMRHPGGCILGRRPVGTHFQAIYDLGGEIETEEEHYHGTFSQRRSESIYLDEASVTATENAIMLAALTPGTTTIHGAASEPHVASLAEYLNLMGAQISGAGTNRITIQGVTSLTGATHTIPADFIETSTFAIMAAATHSQITIHNANQHDFHMTGVYLRSLGVDLEFTDANTLVVRPSQLHQMKHIKEFQTRPWPGYPTDAFSPLVVLATQVPGFSLFHEWMYDGRLLFTDKLISMGANIITCDPHRAIVQGVTPLRGKKLESPDIRAGIALVIAGLLATCQTQIDNAQLIFRGYGQLVPRLQALGADIKEID